METSTTRVGIYARISEDKDGQQTATARQREDCEAFAVGKGWDVADNFEDIDISAFSLRARSVRSSSGCSRPCAPATSMASLSGSSIG